MSKIKINGQEIICPDDIFYIGVANVLSTSGVCFKSNTENLSYILCEIGDIQKAYQEIAYIFGLKEIYFEQ
jgi:hypothetical protein